MFNFRRCRRLSKGYREFTRLEVPGTQANKIVGGYFSQNDLRVHFGISKAEKIDLREIRWQDIKPNQVIYVKEGEEIVHSLQFVQSNISKKACHYHRQLDRR
jgi:ASPIC and UnbV